ncbi:MAG: NADH-quinone oxidoreductase subunit NuoE, partial [Gordonia sp. (in: high G+C Gram-positive bacteria)]
MTEVFLEVLKVRPESPPADFSTSAPHPPVALIGPETYDDDVLHALRAEAEPIVARYPQARSALLPLLHLVQSHDGYVTRAGVDFCTKVLNLTHAQVTAVVTFYSMYRREPTGEHLVGVCTNSLCAILGGDEIMARLCDRLGVESGGTTDDGRITLEHIECNAACDFAPVVMVNWEFFDDQTPGSAVELVEDLRAGQAPTPSRGPSSLATFRENERLLAGVAAASALPEEEVSTRFARSTSEKDARPTSEVAPAPPARSGDRTRWLSERSESKPAEPEQVPVLSRHWGEPESWTLQNYLDQGGYRGLKAALAMEPGAVIDTVKAAGLRGRGGAGFPVGLKWSFIPQDDPAKPKYLVVNADESEPGTCKDMPLMLATPHALVEG